MRGEDHEVVAIDLLHLIDHKVLVCQVGSGFRRLHFLAC